MVFPGNKKYLNSDDFPNYEGKSITFCITNECNLRCTYCYIHNKNSEMDMTFETAKEIVDTMFANPTLYFDDSVDEKNKKLDKSDPNRTISKRLVFDFIGGEPFIRPELIDQISDYIKYKNIKEGYNFPFMFSFSTNGVTYLQDNVQDYIKKNKNFVSVGITIDGTKQMHDACRIFPEGEGSYDIVEKSVEKWLKDFPGSGTKVTIAPENLPYLSEALIHLWENVGIQFVPANVVFEDKWTDEHPPIFERELTKIKDFLLKDKNYTRFTTTLFDDSIGKPIPQSNLSAPCGGNGAMLHWMHDGSFYNCIRYAPTSCKDGKGYKLGDLKTGWDPKAHKCLCAMDRRTSSDDECFNCEVASGCSYCPGAQYDYFGNPDQRAKYICEMHKSRVKISNAFFEELHEQAEEMDFGDDIIYMNLSRRERDYIHDVSNQISHLKSFLALSGNYPDVDMEKVLAEYHEKYDDMNQFMTSVIEEYLEGLPAEEYVMDWARNYAIKKELFEAKIGSKQLVLNK